MIVAEVWKALGIESYDQAKPYTIWEHVENLRTQLHTAQEALQAIREGSWATEKWGHKQGVRGCRDLAKVTLAALSPRP